MIRVIIEREIKPGACDEYFTLIRQAKKEATTKDGFLGGELLHDVDNDHRVVILASWDNLESWNLWNNSDERERLSSSIEPLLLQAERVTVLETGPT